jgi:transposase-like protein
MEIMHTMASEAIAKHPKRRVYSPELKSQVVAACQRPGASVAGVALARGINANIVHRWLREHARGTLPVSPQEFVALPLRMPVLDAAKPDPVPAKADGDIRIEVRRGAGSVTVNWPLQAAASCTAWLREFLR